MPIDPSIPLQAKGVQLESPVNREVKRSNRLGHAIYFNFNYTLWPKIAEPMRMCVAPSAMASSKSALIPIESFVRLFSLAIFASKAKYVEGASLAGGTHINPTIFSLHSLRAKLTKSCA